MSTPPPKISLPDSPEPRSYLIPSIICTLFCFPTAAFAIRESIACERFKSDEQMDLAEKASKKAKWWIWNSIILGFISLLVTGIAIYEFWPLIMDGVHILRTMILERFSEDSYYL